MNLIVLTLGLGLSLMAGLKIWRQPVFGLALVGFLLTFERIPTLDLAGFTFKTNHLVGLITLTVLSIKMIRSQISLKPSSLAVAGVLVLASQALSIGASQQPVRSFIFLAQSTFVLALAWAAIVLIDSRAKLKLVSAGVISGAILASLIGLWQLGADLAGLSFSLTGLDPGYTKAVLGFPRIHAFAKEPLYFANFLFLPIGLASARWLAGREQKNCPWGVILIILLVVFVLTFSRGGYLGLVVGFLAFSALVGARFLTTRVLTALFLGLASLIVLAAVSFESLSLQLKENLASHVSARVFQSESIEGRLIEFDRAFELWRSSQVIGVGLGNYGPRVRDLTPDERGGYPIVNNQYIESLVETGIIGLVSLIGLLVLLLHRSWLVYTRARSDDRLLIAALTSALIATLVQYNFFSTFAIIQVWFLVGLLAAAQNVILGQNQTG